MPRCTCTPHRATTRRHELKRGGAVATARAMQAGMWAVAVGCWQGRLLSAKPPEVAVQADAADACLGVLLRKQHGAATATRVPDDQSLATLAQQTAHEGQRRVYCGGGLDVGFGGVVTCLWWTARPPARCWRWVGARRVTTT